MDDGVLLRAEVDIQGATQEELARLPRPDVSASIPVISPTRPPSP
jgi:hypothetical protein